MIYAFLPLGAAMLYGLAFALMERVLQVTNVFTYMLMGGILFLPMIGLLSILKKEPIDFGFLHDKSQLFMVFVAVVAPSLGWLLTAYTIKNVNASYAAFAEISYPLFTVLFAFLLLGVRQFDWHVLAGGALILIGSSVLVYGQLKLKP